MRSKERFPDQKKGWLSLKGYRLKVLVYNSTGQKKSEREIEEKLFSLPLNPVLLHEAVKKEQSNSRVASAKTKTRAAVSGGGKKPWRQKGTGRARTGSIRNPIWRGGGIIFGPTGDQNYHFSFPRKKSKLAIISALISKKGEIIEIDKISCQKTREAEKMLSKIIEKQSALLIFNNLKDDKNALAFRNLKTIKTIDCKNLNVCDLLRYKKLIFVGDALDQTAKSLKVDKK